MFSRLEIKSCQFGLTHPLPLEKHLPAGGAGAPRAAMTNPGLMTSGLG